MHSRNEHCLYFGVSLRASVPIRSPPSARTDIDVHVVKLGFNRLNLANNLFS